MNLDEPEFQKQDANTRSAMTHALDILAKAAEKEQPGSHDPVPPLPEDLRDQWLRELDRQQVQQPIARREPTVGLMQRLSEWWHAPKFWLGGLTTAAVVIVAVLMMHTPEDNGRITRGGEGTQASSSIRIAVIAETAAYEEFRSLRSGEAPARYESREQAQAELGSAAMLLVDFSTKKILLYRDGQLQREVDFPSDDLLDISMAVDEIMAP